MDLQVGYVPHYAPSAPCPSSTTKLIHASRRDLTQRFPPRTNRAALRMHWWTRTTIEHPHNSYDTETLREIESTHGYFSEEFRTASSQQLACLYPELGGILDRCIIAHDVSFSWRRSTPKRIIRDDILTSTTKITPTEDNTAPITSSPVTILDKINLVVKPGEVVMLLGGNGSGKSTLLRILRGMLRPDHGILTIPHNTSLVLQSAGDTIIMPTVEADILYAMPSDPFLPHVENVDANPVIHHQHQANLEYQARLHFLKECLEAVRLGGYEKRAPRELSGGERQRAALAAALAMKPDAFMFDEVTASMDAKSREDILDMICSLAKTKNIPILWVTHLIPETKRADRILLMKGGRVAMSGTYDELSPFLKSIGAQKRKVGFV